MSLSNKKGPATIRALFRPSCSANPVSMDHQHSHRSIKSRKACKTCAYAKRQCDKGVPTCKRCQEMEISCQYPAGRPYSCRTKPPTSVAQSSQRAPRTEHIVDLEGLDDSQSAPKDETCEEFTPLDVSSSLTTVAGVATSSWFLQADSWTILHPEVVGTEEDVLARMSDLKEFIVTVRSWISQWAREAHCPILHRHLYSETGLPQCLEEAFAAVTMFEAKTDANEEVVLRIIEKSADKLLQEALVSADSCLEEGGALGLQTAEHLARVQALFIYQFLRLFGSDIRQRARAEAATPAMMGMNSMMWDSANTNAYLETSLGFVGLFSQSLRLGGAGPSDPWGQQWRDWLLAESVRRIWLMVNYTHAVYTTLRDGLGSCSGGVAFTARKGLWDAQSAWSWRQIVQKHDPLFVQCQAMEQIMLSLPVKEVDSFCLSVVGIMWGAPKLDLWRAKSEALLSSSSIVNPR